MVMFNYVEPGIVPDEAGYKREHVMSKAMMPEAELEKIVFSYLAKIKLDELKTGEHFTKYKFSLYDLIYKITPYSYVSKEAWQSFVSVLTNIGPYAHKESDVSKSFLTKLLGVESCFFNMEHQPYNLFLRQNILDKRGRYRDDVKEGPLEYKIHLCVKEEYAFYTFLKLGVVFFPEFRKIYPDKYLEMKWNLDARMTHLSADDTVYRKINGGPAASIVIYTRTSTKDVITFMLRALLTGFPEADTIGFMELNGNLTLPYANVRLNKMLCYAQGDRGTKLRAKRNNLTMKNGSRSQKYIPDWVIDIQSKCGTEEANNLSQLYLGIDICPIGDVLHDDKCVDDICYLAIDKNMLDPRLVLPIGTGGKRKTRRLFRRIRGFKTKI